MNVHVHTCMHTQHAIMGFGCVHPISIDPTLILDIGQRAFLSHTKSYFSLLILGIILVYCDTQMHENQTVKRVHNVIREAVSI